VDGVSSGSGRECDAPGAHDNFPKQNGPGPGSPDGEEDGGCPAQGNAKVQYVLTVRYINGQTDTSTESGNW
jgi:hypothetical protein